MKSIIIIAIVLLGCVAINQGRFFLLFFRLYCFFNFSALDCYSHNVCSANCPQLKDTVKTCTGGEDKCYKAAFPGGVSRGCAKDRCNVQVHSSF
jgi:hypothetical protein